tara:strand:+ start:7433 stop:9370 length:1938 start_codon:yes stop_codon:yes gene_type:complete
MKSILNSWFTVDSRSLGIFRILIGWVCTIDIIRRWNYIDVFYSNSAIQTKSASQFLNIFNLIGNDSFSIKILFIIGIFFAISFMIGYRTKISHIVTSIIIISLHGQVEVIANSGDTFLNCILIWTLFLPLNKSLSIDALINNLNYYNEPDIKQLNDRTTINKPENIFSIAYFATLLQISAIYFLSAINRTGGNWSDGTAFYKMHHLDGFITSFGYYIRDYINLPISKIFTFSTLYLEMFVPILIFLPFYNIFLRRFAIISLTSFHIMIRLSMYVGLFSQVMISSLTLLIDNKIYDFFKKKFKKRKKYYLFYDADCGFCHFSVRLIKRLDVFERILFSNNRTDDKKPDNYEHLYDKTAILYDKENNIKWIRHEAFGKIISLIPFGIFISWIFFIPYFSKIFGVIYDTISTNRTKISTMFGLPACGLPMKHEDIDQNNYNQKNHFINDFFKILSPILLTIMLTASVYSAFINHDLIGNVNWVNKLTLRQINKFPLMAQRWEMFENVPSSDEIIIISATLLDGTKINPFTGKSPVLNSTDYKYLSDNKNQFWRKYFEWLYNRCRNNSYKKTKQAKIQSLMLKSNLTNWIQNPQNTYFDSINKKNEIIDVEVYRVTQACPKIEEKKSTEKGLTNKAKFVKLEKRMSWGN